MPKKLTEKEVLERRERFKEALKMQEIESSPLTQEDIEMFEMFDRKGWDDEKCLEYIKESIVANNE